MLEGRAIYSTGCLEYPFSVRGHILPIFKMCFENSHKVVEMQGEISLNHPQDIFLVHVLFENLFCELGFSCEHV